MANADHLVGALAITVAAIACADVARPARLVNVALGAALLVTPFAFDAGTAHRVASIACGLALIALSLPRGPIRGQYGRFAPRVPAYHR